MHYHEHLGKQAVSFLRNLMKQYGNDKFEEQFFEMLKSYPSLNGLLLSDMKEGENKMLNNEEAIKIMKQFRDRQGNSDEDIEAFDAVIKTLKSEDDLYKDLHFIVKRTLHNYAVFKRGKIICVCTIKENADLIADILNADIYPYSYGIYPFAKYKIVKMEGEEKRCDNE